MKRLICAILFSSICGVANAEVAVIVNPAATAAPSQSEVANIFLGKDKSLTAVDQQGWNATKEAFYTGVTNKNEAQLKSYWSGLIFTGKGQPPSSVADDSAVVAAVASDAGKIGYVDSGAVSGDVKVLFTLP